MKTFCKALILGVVMLGAGAVHAAGAGDDDVKPMTAAQLAQYRAERDAAKAQWAKMTPQQRTAAIQSAKNKRLADLTAIERFGQNDDMMQETAKQTAAIKAQSDAAKAQWAQMTPAQREAVRKASWKKKRAELTAMERVGQNNDTDPDVVP